MKRIHRRQSARIQIGEPFEQIINELLKKTNEGNLSADWNTTDMARYAVAELWRRTGKPLPQDAERMLKKYYADLDDVHSG